MSFQQLKWLILTVPTVTIGVWEWVRHQFLLPYVSMEMGNWLSPLLVWLVTVTLLRKLFSLYEDMHADLHAQQTAKAALQERERMIQTLHDDIAQSLFLLSVQLERLEHSPQDENQWVEVKRILRQVHDDVRQAIADLRQPGGEQVSNWQKMFEDLVNRFERESGVRASLQMEVEERVLTTQEKVALIACLREALMNVRKHARATHVWVKLLRGEKDADWIFLVQDDGNSSVEWSEKDFPLPPEALGLVMMRERADRMGWHIWWGRQEERTTLRMSKGEKRGRTSADADSRFDCR